jgi:hypothetical protein
LDQGDGVVFCGDNREGFNGGASLVRWVVNEETFTSALAFLREQCDNVRVMPFLEGRPCSIHAFVTPDGTAVFRPCEMLVFRDKHRFQYASAATYWDCPPVQAATMRQCAQRVASHLQATTGYRGMFTLDGVLTRDGFRPTELNPRVGAAFGQLVSGAGLPFELMHYAAIEGLTIDWQPERLERAVLDYSATRRNGRAGMLLPDRPSATTKLYLRDVEGQLQPCDPSDADLTTTYGPATAGGYLGIAPVAGRVPIGPAFAPRAVRWLRQSSHLIGVDFPPMQAAPDRIWTS